MVARWLLAGEYLKNKKYLTEYRVHVKYFFRNYGTDVYLLLHISCHRYFIVPTTFLDSREPNVTRGIPRDIYKMLFERLN